MGRFREYYRLLHGANLEAADFVEACDRIMMGDSWFPTVARIIEVVDTCAKERRLRERAARPPVRTDTPLVCGRCHGARYVRLGGYSPSTHPDVTPVGSDGSRTDACPDCTVNGRYDAQREARAIFVNGGVPDPSADYQPDMNAVTWPAKMRELRGPDGTVDMDALYRLSRELRGLDPDVDERVRPVAGWKTVGSTREAVPA